MSKALQLRQLLLAPEVSRVAGAHDALSARVAEEAGFDAVWASSFTISAARGLPDMSLLSMDDYLSAASSMNEVCRVPVIADCDTGFGDVMNVAYMVRRYEAAGIAGVCIEDKVFPKRNSFLSAGQVLDDPDAFARKIEVAKRTQRDPGFVVIARTEAMIAGAGVDEALARSKQYVDAGADAVLAHSKAQRPDEIVDFLKRWSGQAPVVVVPTTYHTWRADEAEDAGVSVIIYANQSLRAAVTSMWDVLREVREAGCSSAIEPRIAPMKDIFELSRVDEWLALDS